MLSRNLFRTTLGALLLLLLSVNVQSDNGSMETGWMDLVKGARDSASGAQVVEIEDGDSADTQKITLAIPKKSVANPNEIEEVLVIGQMPDKPKQSRPVKFSYEWVSDYDSENYGLVIRLGRNTNWPIRLYMNSDPGFIR
ncbi:MAG: hypothetical protein R3E64_03860 [Halioglobus sp.]